jgi:hypothetical protein
MVDLLSAGQIGIDSVGDIKCMVRCRVSRCLQADLNMMAFELTDNLGAGAA